MDQHKVNVRDISFAELEELASTNRLHLVEFSNKPKQKPVQKTDSKPKQKTKPKIVRLGYKTPKQCRAYKSYKKNKKEIKRKNKKKVIKLKDALSKYHRKTSKRRTGVYGDTMKTIKSIGCSWFKGRNSDELYRNSIRFHGMSTNPDNIHVNGKHLTKKQKKDFKELCEEIYVAFEKYRISLGHKIRKCSVRKYKHAIKQVILNILFAAQTQSGVAIPLGKDKYAFGTQMYKLHIGYRVMKEVLEFFRVTQLSVFKKGFFDREMKWGRVTRMFPTVVLESALNDIFGENSVITIDSALKENSIELRKMIKATKKQKKEAKIKKNRETGKSEYYTKDYELINIDKIKESLSEDSKKTLDRTEKMFDIINKNLNKKDRFILKGKRLNYEDLNNLTLEELQSTYTSILQNTTHLEPNTKRKNSTLYTISTTSHHVDIYTDTHTNHIDAHTDTTHSDTIYTTEMQKDRLIKQIISHTWYLKVPVNKRIFNHYGEIETLDESLCNHGRFYNYLQNLPSAIRKKLLFYDANRKMIYRVVEIDFSALHPTMAYIHLNLEPKDNPYIYDKNDTKHQTMRKFYKLVVLCGFNAPDMNSLMLALRKQVIEKGFPEYMSDLTFIKESIDKFLSNHKEISRLIASGIGRKFMFMDSEMMRIIMTYFAKKGIRVVCVHDSVIIAEEHREELEEVMVKTFQKVMCTRYQINLEAA